MRKRSITLIEILVGFTLFAFLSSFLFATFVQTKKLEMQNARLYEEVEERFMAYERLSFLFGHLWMDEEQITWQMPHLQELQFAFDNGIDPEPAFSSKQMARLYLEENNLMLAITPIEDRHLIRKEVILKNCEHLCFRFDGKEGFPDEKKMQESIRVCVMQGGQEIIFPFCITHETLELRGA